MAYMNLSKIEPVNFGGRECTPIINTETKMRLSQIKNYDESSIAILASAFPNDEAYVKEFLYKMSTVEIEMLHAYLVGGPTMVEMIKEKIAGTMNSVEEKNIGEENG